MGEQITLAALAIYLLKTVRVSMLSKDTRDGKLTGLDVPGNGLVLDGEMIPLTDVSDVEFLGMLNGDHFDGANGEIEGVSFSVSQVLGEFNPEQVVYGDFACRAVCHLTLEGGSIRGLDVKVISCERRLTEGLLTANDFWYKLKNTGYVSGRADLSKDAPCLLCTNGTQMPLRLEEVESVTRIPRINDYVYIEQNDGTMQQGLVSAFDGENIVLIADTVSIVSVGSISGIRYKGWIYEETSPVRRISLRSLTTGSPAKEDLLIIKRSAFRSDFSFSTCQKGDEVSFELSAGADCLSAKAIKPEKKSSSAPVAVQAATKPKSVPAVSKEHKLAPNEKLGYVLLYVSKNVGNEYGFIIGPELLEDYLSRNERAGNIYFNASAILNPGQFNINTFSNYYCVSYVPVGERNATKIRILEEIPFHPKKAMEAMVSYQEPTAVYEPELLSLKQFEGTVQEYFEGANPVFGFVVMCSSNFATIHETYVNKVFADENSPLSPTQTIFDPHRVRYVGADGMKTAKQAYLVRYVPKGTSVNQVTGKEQPTIDYEYPVEILLTLKKALCKSMVIRDGMLIIGKAGTDSALVSHSPGAPRISERDGFQLPEAPEMLEGETILVRMKDQTLVNGSYSREDDDSIVLQGGTSILRDNIYRIYRFGIVTSFNYAQGTMVINNHLPIMLNLVEQKVINILKTPNVVTGFHVIYVCEDELVVEVCRITEEYSRNIVWQTGTVTASDTAGKVAVIDGKASHFFSVLSDGKVSRMFRDGSLLRLEVYTKLAAHPYYNAALQKTQLRESAIEVRCIREDVTVKYDAGRASYLGYRNTTFSFPVTGPESLLQEKINRQAEVTFVISDDGCSLEARIGDDIFFEQEPEIIEIEEEENVAGQNVTGEKLVAFCMEQAMLMRRDISDIEVDEEGNPKDPERVQKLFEKLSSQTGEVVQFAAAGLTLRFPEIKASGRNSCTRLIRRALRSRSIRVERDVNFVPGEYAYLATLLLHYPKMPQKGDYQFTQMDCLYRLFLSNFGSRENMHRILSMKDKNTRITKEELQKILSGDCRRIWDLINHLIVMDQSSLEIVCPLIEEREGLKENILKLAVEIDASTKGLELHEAIIALRTLYKKLKNHFSSEIETFLTEKSICSNMRTILLPMEECFLKFVGVDDYDRFTRLLSICNDVCDFQNQPGFSKQEELLRHAYRMMSELEEEIKTHPCRESLELLVQEKDSSAKNVIDLMKEEISALINELYSDPTTIPRISCSPNEVILEENSTSFWLVVRNGDSSQKLQPADDVKVRLTSFTEGVSVPELVQGKNKHLGAGEQFSIEVPIESEIRGEGAISIGWSVEFDYAASFSDGYSQKVGMVMDNDELFSLQYGSGYVIDRTLEYENPYTIPAIGKPLEDQSMFFGRITESEDIRSCIIQRTEEGEDFIPGSAVIIHGQKKSGKTSLVNQIKKYIADDEILRDRAIILDFPNILDQMGGAQALPYFKKTFYANILNKFKWEIRKNHKDVKALFEENGLEIPNLFAPTVGENWVGEFDNFFEEFKSIDEGRHTVILFMDEFTTLCTTILSVIENDRRNNRQDNEHLAGIPKFIRTFSQNGIIQFVIGHEAMMRAFDTMNVLNHTAEFAKSIEIGALDHDASVSLVVEPMKKVFGFDVYGTELGAEAVERLLDLSGCNPTYLMRLCDQMFNYYVSDRCTHSQLISSDVEKMLEKYVNTLLITKDFDIVLGEDGDDVEESEKRGTYLFLRCVSILAKDHSFDGRSADIGQLFDRLKSEGFSEAEIESTRTLLDARRVISAVSGGRIKINTGLFQEFVIRRNGGR